MWQVKDHVSPSFALRIPTVFVLLSTLFQTVIKDNVRINILKPGGLAKSDKLEVYKAILNNI
jgi:hypothetical protein